MRTQAPRVPERAFQMGVIQYAHANGWMCAHFNDSRRQIRPGVFVGDRMAKGYPDLTLARERVIFAELKREGGALTDDQARWLRQLREAGAEVYIWTPENWGEIEETLTARRACR